MAVPRAVTTSLLVASICLLATSSAAENQEGPAVPDRVVIQGVDRYRVVEPLFESVRVTLAQRGEAYSSGYIQGIAGSAFRIAGICPCAPTVSRAMEPTAIR